MGPHQIEAALKKGHKVSTFTRGKTAPTIYKDLFDQVESLVGDRNDNLEALKNRKWDVVIDNSGNRVQWVEDTAKLLKDNADLYMYTSSVSVYFPYTGSDFSESRKVIMEVPTDATGDDKASYDYGVMKAQSEQKVREIFGADRATLVRPHFIVGPADKTNRFIYWPARLEIGGDVLLPGQDSDRVQYIDVRDLGEWMIHLAENKIAGTFNASGPGSDMTIPQFVYGAHAAFNSDVNFIRVDDHQFLEENNMPFLCPWVLPTGKYIGMMKSDNQRAIDNGLTFRPLADTVRTTIDWWNSEAVSQERRDKFVNGAEGILEREKAVLEAWKGR